MKTAKWIVVAVLIAGLCAICSYAAWSWRGTHDAKLTADQVNAAYADARDKIAEEHALFAQYTEMADKHFTSLEGQVASLTLQGALRHGDITHEIQTTPFYQQPLPATGYALWIAARSSFASHSVSSHSSSWPPSSASAAAPAPKSADPTSAPMTRPGSR